MAREGIVPIELELTAGTARTLHAPSWREGNAEWQALLGHGDAVALLPDEASLLVLLESGEHDFTGHPDWARFSRRLPGAVIARSRDRHDVVGLPAVLAGKPNQANVAKADRVLTMVRSIGEIAGLERTRRMFASNSVLASVAAGADHFHGAGEAQWTAIGRVIEANWDAVVDELDELWGASTVPEADEGALADARARIDDAAGAVAAEREEAARRREEERHAAEAAAEAADPYDSTTWASAGIDPVRISIAGRTLYTLRCYLGGRPVFLGRHGVIRTFPQGRQLVRWLLEHDDHDMVTMSTWDEIITAANAGELELTVHPDNAYSFAGLAQDIKAGPGKVDAAQLGRAYELLADAADWAGDDSVNEVLAANQQLQWFLNAVLDTGEISEPVPPYEEEADGWVRLEKGLVDKLSTKL